MFFMTRWCQSPVKFPSQEPDIEYELATGSISPTSRFLALSHKARRVSPRRARTTSNTTIHDDFSCHHTHLRYGELPEAGMYVSFPTRLCAKPLKNVDLHVISKGLQGPGGPWHPRTEGFSYNDHSSCRHGFAEKKKPPPWTTLVSSDVGGSKNKPRERMLGNA